MPKRIVPKSERNARVNASKNLNRKNNKSKTKKLNIKKNLNNNNLKKLRAKSQNISNIKKLGGLDFKNINLKNINLNNIKISRKSIYTTTTIAVASVIGIVAINTVTDSNENVEAIEQVVLPERKMAGVNKEGQKYADNAKVVMEKLRNYQFRNDGKKVVYLTFDDGPSSSTNKILDILDKNDIKATFFITGHSLERAGHSGKEALKRMYNSGNAIANHSYSHDYNVLYPNSKLDLVAFLNDFEKTNTLLKETLGQDFYTNVYRCPGGYMSWKGMEELDSYLAKNNIASIDWNALNGDGVGKGKTTTDLYNEVVKTSEGKEMVVLLMHDASSKEATINSLQNVIDYYKVKGYEFRTLS